MNIVVSARMIAKGREFIWGHLLEVDASRDGRFCGSGQMIDVISYAMGPSFQFRFRAGRGIVGTGSPG